MKSKGYGEITDFGSDDVIYAHVAVKVAEAVASGEYDRGILLCGTGIGVFTRGGQGKRRISRIDFRHLFGEKGASQQ